MPTIPRTYLTTSKAGLNSIQPKNGQVIAVWDSDEVWYDAPMNGAPDGNPVRRKISGIRVVTTLPSPTDPVPYNRPMSGILYVFLDSETNPDRKLLPPDPEHPTVDRPLYQLMIWVGDPDNGEWLVVGTNRDDANVETVIAQATDKYYLTGTKNATNYDIGSLLKNTDVYVDGGVLHVDTPADSNNPNIVGYISNSVNSINAEKADNARLDMEDQPILDYVFSVSAEYINGMGTRITITPGSGAGDAYTLDAPDTTYTTFSPSVDGLVPHPTGTASDMVLFGDGWKDRNNVQIGTALRAQGDILGHNITETYISDLSWSNPTLTLTYGNGLTKPINVPDTTYSNYDGTNAGLVKPCITTPKASYYLNGEGNWVQLSIPTYDVFDNNNNGLVPAPHGVSGYLDNTGAWTAPTDTRNTVGATNNTSSNRLYLVVAPNQTTDTQSYTKNGAYVDNNGILYSQDLQVVNVGTEADDFDVTEAYAVGDTCKNLGVYYVCITAISATQADPYSGVESYAVGDTCLYGNVIYSCLTAIDYTGVTDYSETASYSLGDKCFYDDETYECIEAIDYSTATNYDTTASYQVNDLVFYGNQTYICVQNTASPAGAFDDAYWVLVSDFDDSKWQIISEFDPTLWDAIKQFDISDWDIINPQELWNKTYNGYTLGSACSKNASDSIDSDSDDIPTNLAVTNALNGYKTSTDAAIEYKIDKADVVAEYSPTKVGGYKIGDVCLNDEDFYVCIANTPDPAGSFDDTKWQLTNVIDYVNSITTDSSFTASSSLASSTITSKRHGGHDYRITIDATNGGSAISAGTNIATTTLSFNKTYAVGLVDTTLEMFTLDGNNLTCNSAIPASAVIKLSINALA